MIFKVSLSILQYSETAMVTSDFGGYTQFLSL